MLTIYSRADVCALDKNDGEFYVELSPSYF